MLDEERAAAFVAGLPKAEVHLHFEGAVPWEMARRWSDRALPERPDCWRKDHRFEDFGEFLGAMGDCWKPHLDSLDRIAEAAGGIYRGLEAQNVRYAEMSFGLAAHRDFRLADTVEALKRQAPASLVVRIIGAVSRDREVSEGLRCAEEALAVEALDGFDLHGDERVGSLRDFAAVFEEANRQGKITKAHAGELTGPDAVRETLDVLGVRRIEHGIGAAGDGALVTRLREEQITLDVCPWSNVKLCVHPDLATHPISALHRSGVRVTASTDDPTVFGHTITDEFTWLITEADMTPGEVGAVAANAFRAGQMDDGVRVRALDEIARAVSSLGADGEGAG